MTVTASDTITLAENAPPRMALAVVSSAYQKARETWQLTLKALAVHLADGGIIGAPSFGGGRAGAIVLEVGTLTLTGGARITNSSFGSGGRVHIAAREALTITGHDQAGVPSGLFFDTFGVGAAGAIAIVTRTLQMDGGAIPPASAEQRWGPCQHLCSS